MGEWRRRATIDIKPFFHPIRDVGGEIYVEKQRLIGHLDPKAIGDLPV